MKYFLALVLFLLPVTVSAETLSPSDFEKTSKVYDLKKPLLEALLKVKHNAMPDAISIGVIGRCQAGIGGCLGEQINIGKKNGKPLISSYTIAGLEAGFAEYFAIENYIALCYGNCNGVEAQGIYVSADGGVSLGAGFNGFIEAGIDLSDLYFGHPDLSNLIRFGVVYIGGGVIVGEGGGVSLGALYYLLNTTTQLNSWDDLSKYHERGPKL